MKQINRIADLLNKNLALLAVAISVFALLVPRVWEVLAAAISLDLSAVPFVGTYFPKLSFVNILLGLIMFGMGITLKAEDFALIAKRPREVLIGVAAQYICMTGIGFLIAQVLQLTGIGGSEIAAQIAVGLVLLGSVPGGTAANVMSFLAKGDVPLSITVIMTGTLAAPVLTPSLTLLLAGKWIEISFWNMFFSIAFVVLIPIFLGLIVHKFAGDKVDPFKKLLVLISGLCVLMVVGTCVGTNQSSFTQNGLGIVLVTVIAVLLHHLLGLVAGFAVGRIFHLSYAKSCTYSLDTGLQNSGLSCTLANSAFPGTMAILPCVLATVVHQIVGPIAANFFAAKADAMAAKEASSVRAAASDSAAGTKNAKVTA